MFSHDSTKEKKPSRKTTRNQAIDSQDFNNNNKIVIKSHYVHERAVHSARSANPERRKLIQRKTLSKGEMIYRLPSLSKCLQHEILPRSSLMLKQICEIGSTFYDN